MSPCTSSIQAYFPRTIKPMASSSQADCLAGDTEPLHESSKAALTQATNGTFKPRKEYQELDIVNLKPGLDHITLTARIANYYGMANSSKMPAAAKGCFKLILKDDTGIFTVKLWYADEKYSLSLGMLTSIWTPHIAHTSTISDRKSTGLMTSIFPERDSDCYFEIHADIKSILCRTPLGHRDGRDLIGLMTLKRFVEGGHELSGSRILMCIKSVGGKKKVESGKKPAQDKVDIGVFDDTEEATLTLWDSAISSVATWQSSQTILLLTNPSFKMAKTPILGLKSDTVVDIDPLIQDAYWLRDYAHRVKKKECVNQAFPEHVFDIETAQEAEERILFTLADVDEWVRANPSQQFIGWLNLVVVEMNLFSLYQRNMLLCEECCGVPLYANATQAKCRNCHKPNTLRLNPKILGLLIDQTGGVTSGKLIWSQDAWRQLLGRTPEELVA